MSAQIFKYVSILVTLVTMTMQKTCLCGKTKDNFSMSINYKFEITDSHVLQQLTNTIQEYQKYWESTKLVEPNTQEAIQNNIFNPLPMIEFQSIYLKDTNLSTGNMQRNNEHYSQYIVVFTLGGYSFQVLVGTGKKKLFENTVIFREDPDNNIKAQMINKNLFNISHEAQKIKSKTNTFKKLSLSNQKRIFLGFDVCNNFLIFIRKFSKQILDYYQEIVQKIGSKPNLIKSQQKWENYVENLHSNFIDVSNVSNKKAIAGCDKPINNNLFKELALINLSTYQIVKYNDKQQKSIYYLTNKSTQIPEKKQIIKKITQKENSVQGQSQTQKQKITINQKNIQNQQKQTNKIIDGNQKPFQSKIPILKKRQINNQTSLQREGIKQKQNNVNQEIVYENTSKSKIKQPTPIDQMNIQRQNNVNQEIVYENTSKSKIKQPTPINQMNIQRQKEPSSDINLQRKNGNINLVQNNTQNQQTIDTNSNKKLIFKKGNIITTGQHENGTPVVKINLNTKSSNQQKQEELLQHIKNNKQQIRQNMSNLGKKNKDNSTEDLINNLQVDNPQPMQLNLENLQKLNQQNKRNDSNELESIDDSDRSYSQDDLNFSSNEAMIDTQDQESIDRIVREDIDLVPENINIQDINISNIEQIQVKFQYHGTYLVTLLIENQQYNESLNQQLKEVFQFMKDQYNEEQQSMLQALKERQLQLEQETKLLKDNMKNFDMNQMPPGSKITNLDINKTLDHYMYIMYQVKNDEFFYQENLINTSQVIYDHSSTNNQDINIFIQQYLLENQLSGAQTYKPNLILDFVEFINEETYHFKIFYHSQSKKIFTSLRFNYQDIGQDSFLFMYFIHNSYEIELEVEITQYSLNTYTLQYLEGQSQTYKEVQINHNGDHISGLENFTEQERESAFQFLKVMSNSDNEQSEQARFLFNNWDKLTKRNKMIRRMLLKRLI